LGCGVIINLPFCTLTQTVATLLEKKRIHSAVDMQARFLKLLQDDLKHPSTVDPCDPGCEEIMDNIMIIQ
jgi:hypothetical protein